MKEHEKLDDILLETVSIVPLVLAAGLLLLLLIGAAQCMLSQI